MTREKDEGRTVVLLLRSDMEPQGHLTTGTLILKEVCVTGTKDESWAGLSGQM